MGTEPKAKGKKTLNGIDKVLMSDSERFEYAFAKNWKKLLILSVVLVAVIVAVFFHIHNSRKNAAENEEALAAADIAQLPQLIKKSDTAAGLSFARIRLAEDLERRQKFAEAQALYQDIAADSKADIWWRNVARLNSARCIELTGKYADAAEAYRKLALDADTPQVIRTEAGYQSGRLLAKGGDRDGALKVLNDNVRIGSAAEADMMSMLTQMWVQQSKVLAAEIRSTVTAAKK